MISTVNIYIIFLNGAYTNDYPYSLKYGYIIVYESVICIFLLPYVWDSWRDGWVDDNEIFLSTFRVPSCLHNSLHINGRVIALLIFASRGYGSRGYDRKEAVRKLCPNICLCSLQLSYVWITIMYTVIFFRYFVFFHDSQFFLINASSYRSPYAHILM